MCLALLAVIATQHQIVWRPTPSSSPSVVQLNQAYNTPALSHPVDPNRLLGGDPTEPITFSEFPVGTQVTDQYSSKGIIFGGSSPFITPDGANPTSPVLSGTPIFQGNIEGHFVSLADPTKPAIVESFTMDAGYFDELHSTRIEWFDSEGTQLGSVSNSQFGIERFEITGGDIASWRISIFATEPAGFGIDNFSSIPVRSSILFRELSGDDKDGTWGFFVDEIPGFDHTALNNEGSVFESHPGYHPGTYQNNDGTETIGVAEVDGVQNQHTRGTFEHDSMTTGSPVIAFEEIPIPQALATAMADRIATRIGTPFQFIDYSSLESIERTLAPSVQKGGNGTFTCVGLVEWAAEQAGHGGGQGFILNSFESFSFPDFSVTPPVFRTLPLLSPQLLNYAMKTRLTLDAMREWLQGLFDPVDFMITDPIGRKLGSTPGLGQRNEIPRAFYGGNGKVEQFMLPRPVSGTYRVDLEGLNTHVLGGIGSSTNGRGVNQFLGAGQPALITIMVPTYIGAPGDVTRDGTIDDVDRAAIVALLHTFADGPTDPADIDLDGKIDELDLDLLEQILKVATGIHVVMDIRPEDGNGVINLRSRGVIPLAIISTPEFDATTIDVASVRFGPGEAREAHRRLHLNDVDNDGDLDAVLHFRTSESGIQCGDTTVSLSGATNAGLQFEASDTIVTIQCR